MPEAIPAARTRLPLILLVALLVVPGGCLDLQKKKAIQPGENRKTAKPHGAMRDDGGIGDAAKREPRITVVIRNGDQWHSFSHGDPVSFIIDPCAPVEITVTTNPRKQIRRLAVMQAGTWTTQEAGADATTQADAYPTHNETRLHHDPPLAFTETYDLGAKAVDAPGGDFVSYEMVWDITARNFQGDEARARITGSFARPPTRSPVFVPGVGTMAHGAGTAAGDVNGNGTTDVVLMAYDAPANGGNQFRYRVAWDLAADGKPASWSGWHAVGGVGTRGDGAGADLADLNGNGKLDLVVMAYDDASGANTFRYRVVWDLDVQGKPGGWSAWKEVDGVGNGGEGAGLALANLDGNGQADMVLMAYDSPSGLNSFRYMVGHDLDASGDAGGWSGWHEVAGVGNAGDGAGAAFADLDRSGTQDLVLVACDDPEGANSFRYRVGWNVGPNGATSTWTDWQQIEGLGDNASGAGLTILQLPGSLMPQLLFMAYDLGSEFRYRIVTWDSCGQ